MVCVLIGDNVSFSPAHRGRPRLRPPEPGSVCRVEVRLPVDTAALVYETAVKSDATISATVAALINDVLKPEVIDATDSA